MQVEYGTGFETALNEELERWTHQLKSEDFYTYWDIDQRISTRQANRLEKRSPEKFVLLERGKFGDYARDRVDRANFSWEAGNKYIDMHAIHGVQNDNTNFAQLQHCLAECTKIDIHWLEEYRMSFIEAIPLTKTQIWEAKFQPQNGNYDSHAPLLFRALELTKKSKHPVVEFGVGDGSTPRLNAYCKEHKRTLISCDNNEAWAEKMAKDGFFVIHTEDWDDVYKILPDKISVLFIDHAPGERRIIDIERLAARCEYLVIHDTETDGAGDYKYEKIWHLLEVVDRFRVGDSGAEAVLAKPVAG
jgi:hypothetical protein